MRTSLPLLLAAALPLLAGCSSKSYSLASSTPAGARAEVRFTGAEPRVTLENRGPARLRATIAFTDGEEAEVVEVGEGTVRRRGPGPVTISLEPLGEDDARWTLRAKDATGLAYDLDIPAPPAP